MDERTSLPADARLGSKSRCGRCRPLRPERRVRVDLEKQAPVECPRLELRSTRVFIGARILLAQDDQALPPEVQRMFANRVGATTAEIASGHLAMVSHPADVAKLTRTAAEAGLTVDAVN